jgi:pimeloyl-ACP methyl ester carboxylesterase
MGTRTKVLAATVGVAVVVTLTMPLSSATGGRLPFEDCGDDELNAAGARCATVAVPLDYRQPRGRTIGVRISRIPAGDPARRRGILLFNPGGPGGPGLGYAAQLKSTLGDVADRYDLIGFDPRFVGRSTPITCGPVPIKSVFRSAGQDRAGFEESARLSGGVAKACHDRNAAVLPHAGTRNVARDMDSIRAALGERRLSYYGVSYGTDVGAAYSQLFGHRVDRMVLDSATAGGSEYEFARSTVGPAEAAMTEWAGWVARHGGEYRLGRTVAEVRATVVRLLDRAARKPIAVGRHQVDDNVLPLLLQSWLNDQGNDPVIAAALRDLTDLAAGRQVTPVAELTETLDAYDQTGPEIDNALASSFAVMCSDGSWPTNQSTYWRAIQRSRPNQPVFGPLINNIGPCAFWRATTTEPPMPVGNRVPVLIVQATRDNNTPLAGAVELHRKLTGSRLLTVDVRAHGLYPRRAEGKEPVLCAERAINNYLRDGTPPTAC